MRKIITVKILGSYYENFWLFIKMKIFRVKGVKIEYIGFEDGTQYPVYISKRLSKNMGYYTLEFRKKVSEEEWWKSKLKNKGD